MKMKLLTCALAVILAGCAVVPVILPPATGTAACVVIQTHPEALGYIAAAGEVFIDFGRTNSPPTAADLAKALANLPGGNLNAIYAQAIWAGVVESYTLIYKLADTPEKVTALSTTLTGIGESLRLACATCGPVKGAKLVGPAAPRQLLASPADVQAIADAVAQDLKKWQTPKR